MPILADGPNGEVLQLENGKWVPYETAADQLSAEQELFTGNTTDRSARAQGIKTGLATIAANALSIPHATGELLALGGAIPKTLGSVVAGKMRGEPYNIGERFSAARAEQAQSLPASALLSLPDPDAKDVLAAIGTVPQAINRFKGDVAKFRESGGPAPNPYSAIGTGFNEAQGLEDLAEAEHPYASSMGRTAGDIATMLALRPGERMGGLLGFKEPALGESAGLDRAAKVLGRGLGRVGETGFEGAVLSALGDGDPAETAAYTGGIQALGSGALSAKSAILANPLKSVGSLWLGHEMFKSIAPGPQDAFTSKDTAVNEVTGALALGLLASAAGAGRPTGAISSVLSRSARAGTASGITQIQERKRKPPTGRESKVAQLRGLLGYDEDED